MIIKNNNFSDIFFENKLKKTDYSLKNKNDFNYLNIDTVSFSSRKKINKNYYNDDNYSQKSDNSKKNLKRLAIITTTALLELALTKPAIIRETFENILDGREPTTEIVETETQATDVSSHNIPQPASPDYVPEIEPREVSSFNNPTHGTVHHIQYDEISSSRLTPVLGDISLETNAAVALQQMIRDARNEGVTISVVSGFRSVSTQQYLFHEIARQRGQSLDERSYVSAPPGFSEHHTGYAVDLGDGSANLTESFERTQTFAWLSQNAEKYGFELSFPRDNSQNISYEPWHFRFVGDEESASTFAFAKNFSEFRQ